MKVIFLDVDGVLNTGRFRKILKRSEGLSYEDSQFFFDPIAMKNLAFLVKENDAKIVISSTWRYDKDNPKDMYWKMLIGNLREFGIDDKVIGVTPDLRAIYNTISCRGYEINNWLKDNYDIESFVIIDDDDNMYPLMDKLAYCDEFYGLNNEVKLIANKILNNIDISDDENPLYQKELI